MVTRLFFCAVACLLIFFHQAALAITPPTSVTGKEYSDHPDKDATGALDPEQTIFWTGTGTVLDTFDFTPGAPGPPRITPVDIDRPETDALAHDNDAFFSPLRGNMADLVLSVDGDASILYEDTAGSVGTWATPMMINSSVDASGVLHIVDTDAIELWGPDSTAAASMDDAYNYSLESFPFGSVGPGAADPAMVAIWNVPVSSPGTLGPTAVPLVSTAELGAAILAGTGAAIDIDALIEQLDLDALMLDDVLVEQETPTTPPTLRRARINFSIDPVIDGMGGFVFDGGEIFTWDFDSSAAITPTSFLMHGGHTWDTAFDVMGTFGTMSENVDGIEAVPEPGYLLALVAGGLALLGQRRRQIR